MKKSNQLRVFIYLLLFMVFFVSVKVSHDIHADAERTLRIETELSGEKNRQVRSLKEALEDYEKWEREIDRQ